MRRVLLGAALPRWLGLQAISRWNAWVRLVTMRIILMVIVYGNMDWAIDVKIASVY
jgi:hypothetical protein